MSTFQVSAVRVYPYTSGCVIVEVTWVLIGVWAGAGCFVGCSEYFESDSAFLCYTYVHTSEVFVCRGILPCDFYCEFHFGVTYAVYSPGGDLVVSGCRCIGGFFVLRERAFLLFLQWFCERTFVLFFH